MSAMRELPPPGLRYRPKPRKYEVVDDGPMSDIEKRRARISRRERVKRAEDYSMRSFRAEGLPVLATVPADECSIVGHRWLPERLHTRVCRVCRIWESL